MFKMDPKQLPPIHEKPFMVSPHGFSSFEFICLEESIREHGDMNLQRLQRIERFHPNKYVDDPSLINELKNILSYTHTLN